MKNHPIAGTLRMLGLIALAGCASPKSSVLGKPLDSAALSTVSEINSLNVAPASVSVHGTMVEKCPVAGCWFMLRDKTGIIKVDTKSAGFVVSDVPLNTEMTVTGKPILTGERRIGASGLRY